MTALAIVKQLDRAYALLEQAATLEEVVVIRDQARKLEACAAALVKGTACHKLAYQLCKNAERKTGELLLALPPGKAGRKKSITSVIDSPPARTRGQVMRELSLQPQQGSRAMKLAELAAPDYHARLETEATRLEQGKPARNLLVPSTGGAYDGDEYGTPSEYVEPGRECLGGIDLDVACNAQAAQITRPARFYTKGDSALLETASWKARTVWMNPPYSDELIDAFVDRFLKEWLAKSFEAGITLTNLDAVAWHARLLEACDAFVLPRKRIAFLLDGKPIKSNRQAQTLCYFGPDPDAFLDAYSVLGTPCRTALHHESAPAHRERFTPPSAAQVSAGADNP